MAKKASGKSSGGASVPASLQSTGTKTPAREDSRPTKLKQCTLLDTHVVYCGDNLEQLAKLPDACVDLIYLATAGRPRFVQLARVLKQTGSFYYHCDWHASH